MHPVQDHFVGRLKPGTGYLVIQRQFQFAAVHRIPQIATEIGRQYRQRHVFHGEFQVAGLFGAQSAQGSVKTNRCHPGQLAADRHPPLLRRDIADAGHRSRKFLEPGTEGRLQRAVGVGHGTLLHHQFANAENKACLRAFRRLRCAGFCLGGPAILNNLLQIMQAVGGPDDINRRAAQGHGTDLQAGGIKVELHRRQAQQLPGHQLPAIAR